MAFEQFSSQIAAATDEAARRALIIEIARWRHTHLMDIPAQREAHWALSRLYEDIGDRAAAAREAEGLVSLCLTPPEPARGQIQAARQRVRQLGGHVVDTREADRAPRGEKPARGERAERPDRAPKGEKPARGDRGERAERPPRGDKPARAERPARGARGGDPVAAVLAGRWDDALATLDGASDDRSELIAAWALLRQALGAPMAEHAQLLTALDARLTRRLSARAPKGRAAEAGPSSPEAEALAAAIGGPVPGPWRARADAIDAALRAHPDRADRIAAAALRHHVAVEGPKAVAPWLVGAVARAMAGRGQETRKLVDQLAADGVFAVTAYAEGPFHALLPIVREARRAGFELGDIRRGVLSRGEPEERTWTLRLTREGVESMVAVAPEAHAEWPSEVNDRIVERLPGLCPRVVLVAPGAANEALVAAAGARGLASLASADPAEVFAAVGALAPAGPAQPARPDPMGELRAALSHAVAPTAEALTPLFQALRKARAGLHVAAEALAEKAEEAAVATGIAVLQAADAGTPDNIRLGEGTTLAVQLYARTGDSLLRQSLTTGVLAARYGGDGIAPVLDVARAMHARGLSIARVGRGVLGKERREDPVLDALGDAADGLWRIVLADGAEALFLAGLSPEGRAAVPALLARPAKRAVIIPVEGELLGWYAGLGGPEAIGWTGAEAEEVVDALIG